MDSLILSKVTRTSPTLLAGLLFLFTAPAHASFLYGIQLSSGTGFFDVNQISGALTLIDSTGNTSTTDLTSDLSSLIWTVDVTNAALLTIDPSTGSVSSTTPLTSGAGAPVTIVSLAWNPVTQI